jgi:hypothetical protein
MGLKIDGICATNAIDSSGEILDIEGHDISDLESGKGVLNFEHQNGPEDIVGAIIYAKKLLKLDDCVTERQKKYWNMVKKPCIYIIAELFDEEDSPPAAAVAAMIRYYAKKKEKMLVSYSIEGLTLERDGNVLKRSVGRRVALTLRACNKECVAGLLEEGDYKRMADDLLAKTEKDMLEVDSISIGDSEFEEIYTGNLDKNLNDLLKTLTAGMPSQAPSDRVQGAALQVEKLDPRKRAQIKAAIRDWDKKTPLIQVIKAALPEVSDEYIEHFADLAETLALKKSTTRIDQRHAVGKTDNIQKEILSGIHLSTHPKLSRVIREGVTRHITDSGHHVILSPKSSTGHSQELYYNILRDLGFSDYAAPAKEVSHENLNGGYPTIVQQVPKNPINYWQSIHGANLAFKNQENIIKTLDYILGVKRPRHSMVLSDGRQVKAIDTNSMFNDSVEKPHSISADLLGHGIDKETLVKVLLIHGVDRNAIKQAVVRLAQLSGDING